MSLPFLLFSSSPFPSLRCLRNKLPKVFLPLFYHFLSRKRVIEIGLILLDKFKKGLCKNCSVSCYSRHGFIWQAMRFNSFMVTSFHIIRKRTRNSQKLGNKLKQHRTFNSSRAKRERNCAKMLKSSREKKRKGFQKKKWIGTLCDSNIKTHEVI